MNRRVLLVGVLLVLVALAWSILSAPALPGLNHNSTSTVSVASNSYAYGTIWLNQSSLLVFSYAASSPVNFYLFDASGASYLNASRVSGLPYSLASNMVVEGLLTATLNATRGASPYSSNYSSYGVAPPSFGSGNLSVLLNGTYYFIFSSAASGPANVTYLYNIVPLSNLAGSGLQASLQGSIAPALLFLIGIGMLVYGAITGGQKSSIPDDAEVKRLYANIGGKTKSKRKSKPARRRKR